MNQVMDFLAQNYLYVAAGSLVVIIILILIIVLGNKKRMKKENEEIANIGEIKTGSIDDVANNINANNTSVIAPQEIGEVTQSVPVVGEDTPQDTVSPFVNEMPVAAEESIASEITEPVVEQAVSVSPAEVSQPAAPEIVAEPETPVEPTEVSQPAPTEAVVEPETPIQEEIGIPVIEPIQAQVEPVEIPVIEPAGEVTTEVKSEEAAKTEQAPAEVSQPEPTVETKEELEVFGLDDEPTEKSGTAVAGFSSVNIEK